MAGREVPHLKIARMGVVRVGLLICDHVRPELIQVWGDYEDMFRRLLADYDDIEIVPFDVDHGGLPAAPDECDAWITTGSRHSVNDDEPWIRDLEELVRRAAATTTPFVGVCFGHQLIARALGGTVAKSERGGGVGLKEVEVEEALGLGTSFRILNSHQDQVVDIPPGGRIMGWNEHCPVSMLAVGDNMIGIQGHPEFDPGYSLLLMESRRGTVLPEDVVDAGIASLEDPPDRDRLGKWVVGVLRSGGRRSA